MLSSASTPIIKDITTNWARFLRQRRAKLSMDWLRTRRNRNYTDESHYELLKRRAISRDSNDCLACSTAGSRATQLIQRLPKPHAANSTDHHASESTHRSKFKPTLHYPSKSLDDESKPQPQEQQELSPT